MDPDEPAPPDSPRKPILGNLGGFDPGELLAMGLHTAQPSAGAEPWTPPTAEELAALLPQYGITELLGRGGMGAVYRGVQTTLARPVAIKLLPAELAADPQFVARFEREARTLARLQHPGIVAVHDFGQTAEGHLYFVMEYVEGTDLHRILNGPRLTPIQTLALISQICDALHYAHSEGVIHRDIKPANILVTRDGREKVADFGLARPLREEGATLSSTNVIVGTAEYMAPEQRTGQADERADIYALGVMLYEMLTGDRPHGVFDPPSRKVQVDIRLDHVVLKALQSEPERRYQHASEMKTEVDQIRATPRPAASELAAPTPFSRRRLLILGAAVALGLAVVMGVLFGMNRVRHIARNGEISQPGGQIPPLKSLSKAEAAALAAKLAGASKERPFVNSLGMKFVPVPGTSVLFSIWETRAQDYSAFARVNDVNPVWQMQVFDDGATAPVSREPQHPVCGVSWEDAKRFCQWLTEKETTEGKLPKGATYRLPTDDEWSRAVGLPAEQGATPQEKSGKNNTDFPWGTDFPPKSKVGNYADTSLRELLPQNPWIDGYTDGFAATAPVGSFPANKYGIFDLGGNVVEWCEDWFNALQKERVRRGVGFGIGVRGKLLSSYRIPLSPSPHYRNSHTGFRCVLELAPSVSAGAATSLSTSTSAEPRTLGNPGEKWVDGLAAWWANPQHSDFARENGNAAHALRSPSRMTAVALSSPLTDQAVRVTVRGESWGLEVRREPSVPGRETRAYSVQIKKTWLAAKCGFAVLDKSWSAINTYPCPAGFDWSAPHTSEFRVVGNSLSIFLDGEKLGEMTDDRIAQGNPVVWGDKDSIIERFEYIDLRARSAAKTEPGNSSDQSRSITAETLGPKRIGSDTD